MKAVHDNIARQVGENRKAVRNRIELLRARAGLLVGRDRVLMEMYLDKGNTFRQMATLAGVSEASIARRIHKITKRLMDGAYITCLRNRDLLTPEQLSIARDCLLLGLSQRATARKRQCSVYRVRKTLKRIEKIVKVD